MLANYTVLLLDCFVFCRYYLSGFLQLVFQVIDCVVHVLHPLVVISNGAGKLLLRCIFFLLTSGKSCLLTLALPFLYQLLLLLLEVFLHLLLGVQFVCQKLVVFLVGFLNVGCDLFGVSFLQGFNSLVILFEFFQLFFEFLTTIVKSLLQVHYLDAHRLHLLLVISF